MNSMQRRVAMKIKQIREARGLTQAALAKTARLSLGYIARLEIGRHDPSLSTLVKLAKALKVKVGELVE
jgi:XRE family transcriptional regulator, regulator of sulfur utilization